MLGGGKAYAALEMPELKTSPKSCVCGMTMCVRRGAARPCRHGYFMSGAPVRRNTVSHDA